MKETISATWVIARTTYGETVRRPLYYIVLLTFVFLIFLSQYITLFSFHQEINAVREMGLASLALWGFIILVVVSGLTVTAELEDRTAILVLSKPVSRLSFLLGKYFGLLAALLAGMVLLTLVLFFTLWSAFGRDLLETLYAARDPAKLDALLKGELSVFGYYWKSFLLPEGAVVLEGFLLGFLQIAVLAALCVALSAFFPHVVTVAATTFFFIVGNISAYMLGSIERLGFAPLTFLTRAGTYLLPNLGYFNLQSHFSEGRMISLQYMAGAGGYAVLYVVLVFFIAGTVFERREIR